jgi:hypothetical protein
MPPNVAAAAAAANAAHAAAYAPQAENGQVQPELPLQPPELPDTNPDGSVNWENRFKALKGRWDSDQKRQRETVEQYEARMRELQARANPPPQVPGPTEVPQLVSDKEIEDYGPDLIDVMKRVAQEAVIPMLRPIATEVGTMRARVETTEQETGKQFLQRMNGSMDERIPGWEDINKDPNFIAWTKRNDVYSGLNRQELLQKAWYAGDSNRVAAFFQGFLAEEAAVDPAAAQARQQAMLSAGGHAYPNGGPASSAQPPTSRVTLEQLAAPGRARAATSVPAGKPVWTAEGISTFYMDVARGKFQGRDAERMATEADLMSAQREGRIQINPRTATTLQGH